jgi:hypothetical protein
MRKNGILLLGLLAWVAAVAHAQSTKPTWKNRVSRLIPVVDSLAKPGIVPADSLLAAYLLKLAAAGKVPVYEAYPTDMKRQLGVAEVDHILVQHDTIEVEDPVTGEKAIRVQTRKIQYAGIRYWRIIERWTYDETTGAGKVVITGIAPVVAVYNEDNTFRAYRSLFWYHWEDVQDIINAYGRRNKARDVNRLYLADATGGRPDLSEDLPVSIYNIKQVWLKDTARLYEAHLRPECCDTTLTEGLTRRVLAGEVTAYKIGGNPLQPMTKEEVYKMVAPTVDTDEITDPVTGERLLRVIARDFSYDNPYYKVMLEWKPNMANGEINYRVKAVAPAVGIYDDNGRKMGYKELYWVNYNDFAAAEKKMRLYDPHINLSAALWDVLFTK